MLDLPGDLGVDASRDVVERVHVLDLAARAKLVGAGRANGDVRVDAQRPLLHLCVRDAELDDRLPQELEESLRLLGRADVGSRDDLEQRRAAAVVVDEGVLGPADPARPPAHVDGLRRVLLEVGADDPDLEVTLGHRHYHLAVFARRHIVLRDLIALREIGIEVVLAGEHRPRRDLASEREPELHRPLDRCPVHHRQRPGKARGRPGTFACSRPPRSRPRSGRTSSSAS